MNLTSKNGIIYQFGEYRLDTARRNLTRADGAQVRLMPKAYETLVYLAAHSSRVVEKAELMDAVWPGTAVEENNLNQSISQLRKAFGENRADHRYIATVPGVGYKFVAHVETAENATRIDEIRTDQVSDPDHAYGVDRSGMSRWKWVPIALLTVATLSVVAWQLGAVVLFPGGEPKRIPNGPRSLAVLPFKPLLSEFRDESLELGMADTLIARLSSKETVVLPLASVRKYAALDQDELAAGRELGVESILSGNIQRWGDSLRVNVRLVNVADGAPLWSATFDEKFRHIFEVQDSIARKVVEALSLNSEDVANLEKRYTSNPLAYEHYLRGRNHFFRLTPTDVRTAIEFFNKAVELDPKYSLAYAAMGDAYRTQAIAAHAPSNVVLPKAKDFALKALSIDDSLAEAYTVLGWVAFLYDCDWVEAERVLKRAIELAPNNFEGHRAYAHMLSSYGRHSEAVYQGQIARELAPLTLINGTLDGAFLMYAGRLSDAEERLRKTIELDPSFWVSHNALGRVYIVEGRKEEAVALFSKARELSNGSPEPVAQLGHALAVSGREGEARNVLRELHKISKNRFVPQYHFALVHVGLGENADAISYLEKSRENREAQTTFLYVDTRWDPLLTDRRFTSILKQMNFPELQR